VIEELRKEPVACLLRFGPPCVVRCFHCGNFGTRITRMKRIDTDKKNP
jgi:hypothetical protein